MVAEPENVRQNEGTVGADRTGYALDRTVLANEKTHTAWIRTVLISLAAGAAIEKFMVDALPDWTIRSIAVILIIYSMIAFVVAVWRYRHLGLKLTRVDVRSIPPVVISGASVLLVRCSLLALVGLWLLGSGAGTRQCRHGASSWR